MTKLIFCLSTLLALAAAVDFGHAQAVGDPKEGLALAQQVCTPCHATVPGRFARRIRGRPDFETLQPPQG
jgi:mono/diheme cytochrome c family protein